MGTWFIGAGSLGDVYKVQDVMKCNPIECDDAGRDAAVAFLKGRGTWSDEIPLVHPLDEIFIDGGGAVTTTELKVGWGANGTRFKTFVRQLPFALEATREARKSTKAKDVLFLGGFRRVYYFSEETRRQSILEMERLLKGTKSLRQELEADFDRVLLPNKGLAVNVRACGCLSGKVYGECCGKHVSIS